MRKKIILTIILIITILQVIAPIKIYANNRSREIISEPARIERYKSEQIVSETTGLDTATGLLLEPTVAFFSVVIDAIMQFLSAFMMQEEAKPVMIPESQIDEIKNLGDVGATHTIDDMDPYKNALQILSVEYPNFSYSPEKIFAGELDLLDINFLQDSNQDDNWHKIRNIVSNWYKILRMVTIIGLLSVLIYTGIKIIISSNTKDKAKYKEFFVNWFIGVALVFSLHYIMAFILYLMEEITGLLQGLTGVIEVNAGGTIFQTNLIGLARFKLQQFHFSAKVTYLAMYTALVVYTFKFTFVYLKRVLKMAFLTILAPIVALTYPIDKMNDGKAKGFQMWLKEYIFNALLQPMHYILYYVLVSTSLTLAANNIIYAIAALMFMSEAERLLKRIFGFDKASMGTVGGVSDAFATGAIVSSLTSFVRDPLHPFGGGKGKSSGGSGRAGGGSGNSDGEDSQSINFIDDADVESYLGQDIRSGGRREGQDSPNTPLSADNTETEQGEGSESSAIDEGSEQAGTTGVPEGLDVPTGMSISDILKMFRNETKGNIPDKLTFNDDPRSIEDILNELSGYQMQIRDNNYSSEEEKKAIEKAINDLKTFLMYRIAANEFDLTANSINPTSTYLGNDSRDTSELMEEIIDRIRKAYGTPGLTKAEIKKHEDIIKKLLKKVEMRMLQNQYLEKQGGIKGLMQQERFKNMAVSKNGMEYIYMPNTDFGHKKQEIDKKAAVKEEQKIAKTEKNPQQLTADENKGQVKKGEPKILTSEENKERAEKGETKILTSEENKRQVKKGTSKILTAEENKRQREEKKEQPKVIKGILNVGKTIAKPVWDTEKDPDVNAKRLAGKVFKGTLGAVVGITAATVQAGISITDGKYKAREGIATFAGGFAGGVGIANALERRGESVRDAYYEGDNEKSLEQYCKQWYNRDDIIDAYNREFPGQGKTMRERARRNYVTRGVTDVKEQKKAIKYANQLKKERGMDEEEADKLAVATLQYRRNLTMNSNYTVLFDKTKLNDYLDLQADLYTGSGSKDSVRKLHDDFIQNVRDFDRANQ